jgi:glutamate synthase (NADPH) small chain
MASTCPKCHQMLDDESICCAEIQYTWKCKSCGKLSKGFVVPYGRCFLCGGDNEVIEGYHGADTDQVAIAQEAAQYELDMYHFYKLSLRRTSDPVLTGVLEELYHKEQDHLDEIESKYHLHLDPSMRELAEKDEKLVSSWIFEGIDFENKSGHVLALYDKAIAMERKTRDHFKSRAEAMSQGPQKEIYRELAAEEEEHVSILEGEREQFLKK